MFHRLTKHLESCQKYSVTRCILYSLVDILIKHWLSCLIHYLIAASTACLTYVNVRHLINWRFTRFISLVFRRDNFIEWLYDITSAAKKDQAEVQKSVTGIVCSKIIQIAALQFLVPLMKHKSPHKVGKLI